jgi:hypothetical protein
MSYGIHEYPVLPMQPGADMSGTQFMFCQLDSSGLVRPITNQTTYAFGVVKNQPSSGTGQNTQFIVSVVTGGVTQIQVDAAYPAATYLRPDSTGRGTSCTTDGTHGIFCAAQMIEASTTADDIIPCMFFNQHNMAQ